MRKVIFVVVFGLVVADVLGVELEELDVLDEEMNVVRMADHVANVWDHVASVRDHVASVGDHEASVRDMLYEEDDWTAASNEIDTDGPSDKR